MNIYVGNLSFDTTEEDLRTAFSAHGEVASVQIIMDRDTGRSKGFAFIEMPEKEEALAAIKNLHETELGGRKLNVNEARPRENRPGGGARRSAGGYNRSRY
jgi:RNA recognition motif-containing protein